MKPFILLFVFILLFINSCTEKIEFDIPSAEQKIVLNSLIANDSIVTVKLNMTSPMYQNKYTPVSNAKVELWANNKFKEILIENSPGEYKSINVTFTDTLYTLYVNVSGFKQLKACTMIPKQPQITNGTVNLDSQYIQQQAGYASVAEVSFNDISTEENYYQIIFFSSKYSYGHYDYETGEYEIQDSTLIYKRSYYLNSIEPVIENEGDIQYYDDPGDIADLVFSDKMLNENNSLTFWVINPYSYPSKVIVLMRGISPEYYLYKKSVIRQFYNLSFESVFDIFITDNPIDLYSNVENGLGIFAGYSETHFELTVIGNNMYSE